MSKAQAAGATKIRNKIDVLGTWKIFGAKIYDRVKKIKEVIIIIII